MLSRERVGNQIVVKVSDATDNSGALFVFDDDGMNICIFKEGEWSGFSLSSKETSKLVKLISKSNNPKNGAAPFLRAKSQKKLLR